MHPVNVVILVGVLARGPVRRELPSGDHLVAYEVTVRRPEGRAETVPVVWPGAPPSASTLPPAVEVVVTGRVRRRFFRAGGGTGSRTEVVADAVVPVRHGVRARRAVTAALAAASPRRPGRPDPAAGTGPGVGGGARG